MNSSLKRIFIGIILPILLIAGGIVTVVFSAKTLGKYKTYSETEAVIDRIDAWIWGWPLIALLLATGLLYTFWLKFLPLRFLLHGKNISLPFDNEDNAAEIVEILAEKNRTK